MRRDDCRHWFFDSLRPCGARGRVWQAIVCLLIANLFQGCDSAGDRAEGERVDANPAEVVGTSPAVRGLRYLLSQQGADHLWHSAHYGNLRDGAAISAMVLYACSQAPAAEIEAHRKKLQACANQLQEQVDQRGYVTNPDGPDYSNYGTALFLLATARLQLETDASLRLDMIEYLVEAQLDAGEGYDSEDENFGGWDLSGWMTGERPTTGTNISVTSFVIEAVVSEAARWRLNEQTGQPLEARQKALLAKIAQETVPQTATWLRKCRGSDGGYCFHPESAHAGNKALWSDERRALANSYGTATADGWRIELLLQSHASRLQSSEPESPESSAARWLADHRELKHVPGFADADQPGSWAAGLKFYYWMSLARTAKLARQSGGSAPLDAEQDEHDRHMREVLMATLLESQSEDGSWSNANARMREDDPLIATSFAIIAWWALAE